MKWSFQKTLNLVKNSPFKKMVISFSVVSLILIILIGSIRRLEENGFFNLTDIEFEIVNEDTNFDFLKKEMQETESLLRVYQGQSLWNISIEKIEQVIEKKNWIKEYKLKRRWPHTLVFEVEPYELKFIYLNAQNELFPILSNAAILPKIDVRKAPDVPLLVGEYFKGNKNNIKSAIKMFDSLATEGRFSKRNISEIRYNQKQGYLLTLTQSGTLVQLGKEQFGIKSVRIAKVLDYLFMKNIDAKLLDADLSQKVIVKIKKEKASQEPIIKPYIFSNSMEPQLFIEAGH